jgi:hypothetical protein
MIEKREKKENVFSYVQLRGSSWLLSDPRSVNGLLILFFPVVPLYWTQPSYGLKPAPTLNPERTSEQNFNVLKAHFEKSVRRYGPLVSTSLAERV